MKKIGSFLVCLALLLSVTTVVATTKVANAEVTEPVVRYSQDFNTGSELPTGFKKLTDGNVSVADGRLKMQSSVDAAGNASKNLMIKLPKEASNLKNFTFETKFTIKRSTDGKDNRYMGFMLRMTGDKEAEPVYWHMAVRRNPTNASGVEFGSHTAYNGDKWNIVSGKTYNNAEFVLDTGCLNPDLIHTAKIEVNGNQATTYLNNTQIASVDMGGTSGGDLGLQICNLEVEVDSVVVTEIPKSVNLSSFADEYAYNTSLVCPPVVATNVDSLDKLNVLKKNVSALRPQIGIFKVNKDGNVISSAKESLGDLNSVVSSLVPQPSRLNPSPSLSLMPAFYAEDAAAATKIVEFCQSKGVMDAFVVSSDFNIVKSMRESLTNLRGVLDCGKRSLATTADLLKIRDETNISNSRVAILPKEATREQIDYLQSRLITVWTSEIVDTEELATCVTRGSTGIITPDYKEAYRFLKLFTTPSRAALPYIAAHRGNIKGEPGTDGAYKGTNPANSIEGAKEAYALGADTIESDVYVTSDNKLVIGHDPWLGSFGEMDDKDNPPKVPVSSRPKLEDMTLNEIQTKYFLRGGKCRIPSMAQYFEEFKKDKTTIHFVEIKSYNSNAVPLLKALADEYDVLDQLVVIIFKDHSSQLKQLREVMPEVSIGYLTQDKAWQGVDTIETIVAQTTQYNATYNPHFSMLTKPLAASLLRRGITTWEWTSTENQFAEHFNAGYSGITTNFAYQAADLVVKVTADKAIKVGGDVESAADVKVKLTANTALENPVASASTFIVVKGESVLKLENGKMYGAKKSDSDNTVVVLLGYNYKNEKTGLAYTLYSDPVTVTIETKTTPIPDPTPTPDPTPDPPKKPSGCKSIVEASSLGGMLAVLVLCLVVALVSGKKHNKSFKEEKSK